MSYIGRWIFGSTACDAWILANFLSCMASVFNLCAVSWDRYLAVTSPLHYLVRMRDSKVKIILASVWATSLLMAAVLTYGTHVSEKRTLCHIWGTDVEFVLVETVCGYFIPVGFLVFVNGKVIVVARSQMRRIHTQQEMSVFSESGSCGQRGVERREITRKLQRELRTFKMFLIVIGCFLACWTPFITVGTLESFRETPVIVRHLMVILLYCNSAFNFLISGIVNKDLRKAMIDSFRCKKCC